MNHWQLKKYIPVYTFGSQLHIGFGGAKMEHLIVENSTENNTILGKFVTVGIPDDELGAGLGEKLKSLNFLEPRKVAGMVNRNELFLSYFSDVELTREIRETKILVFGAGAG